jgi:hypothetical protein
VIHGRASLGSESLDVRGRRGRWLLLGTAVAQAISPLFAGFEQGSWDDPIVVPPGPFFAIWGVVTLGSLAAAAWGFPVQRATTAPYVRIQVLVSLAQVGFVAWLVAAALAPVLTLSIFIAMLALLVPSLRAVVRAPADNVTRLLLGGSLGLYTGWATAAVWLNAATLIPDLAADGKGSATTVVLGALLIGASLASVIGARIFEGQTGFVLGAGWGLLGVLLSTVGAGATALSVIAALGLAAVLLTAALARRRSAGQGIA